MRLLAPQRWRFRAGRRRNVSADGFEQTADEALRRPVGESDLPAWAADALEFFCSLLLIRREHDAESREDDVEARIGKRKRFGIGFLECNRQAFGCGAFAPAVEECADVI